MPIDNGCGKFDDINRTADESPELLQSVVYNDRAFIYTNYYLRRAAMEAEQAQRTA